MLQKNELIERIHYIFAVANVIKFYIDKFDKIDAEKSTYHIENGCRILYIRISM